MPLLAGGHDSRQLGFRPIGNMRTSRSRRAVHIRYEPLRMGVGVGYKRDTIVACLSTFPS